MRTLLVGALVLMGLTGVVHAQTGPAPFDPAAGEAPSRQPRNDWTEADVQRAFVAIDRAGGYAELANTLQRYEDVLGSARAVDLVDRRLRDSTINADQRGILILARQAAVDCRERGPTVAAQYLSIRLIASSALVAGTPQQFAAFLERFSELAPTITPRLVRAALDTPGNAWPRPLLPLMEQLALDWPTLGALPAATRMANSVSQRQSGARSAETSGSSADPPLVGHWRTTRVIFESARDDHMVLRADGTAESWSVTASSRGSRVGGRWSSQGSTLSVIWDSGEQISQPFTFHQGQLVLPNVQGRRRFWDRLR